MIAILNYQTIQVRIEQPVCFIRLHRPHASNTINQMMVEECQHALTTHADSVHIVVLQGLPEVFCAGADFAGLAEHAPHTTAQPEALYDLWHQLSRGAFISIAQVRGKANAGGVGFAAACDIVLADFTAEFSLSELLFGLFPACVLPFLIRRIGFQKAHYMTLTTKPVTAQQAVESGMVDACENDSDALLRKHLLRLKRLDKVSVQSYKNYINNLDVSLIQSKSLAISANQAMFSDAENLQKISRYVSTGKFPWEE